MSSVDVLDPAGKKTGSADLPAEIFDVQVNVPLIHQVVVAQLAAARQGTHDTKTRAATPGKPPRHRRHQPYEVSAIPPGPQAGKTRN